jgi:hypothetical protein
MDVNIPVIKYINIFRSKALQNLPKLGFLVWKQTIWQPWLVENPISKLFSFEGLSNVCRR